MATEKRLIYLEDAIARIVDTPSDVVTMAFEGYYGFIKNPASILVDRQNEILDLLGAVPTVDAVEVVHGRWVLTAHEEQCNFRWNVTAECSECQHSKGEIYAGHFSGFPKDIVESLLPMYAKRVKLDNYCPNCGAKMDGDGNG